MLPRRHLALSLAALCLAAAPARAQRDTLKSAANDAEARRETARTMRSLARADSLLRAGRVSAAEELYYAAARRRPRDPVARLALGRYLASRGAVRIGAVLLEEARNFGAPPAAVAAQLAPLYTRMGSWKALNELTTAPLTAGERERATWLAERESAVAGPDSTSVPLVAAPAGALGAVVLRLGTDSVVAVLDPDARGIVLDGSRQQGDGVRRFTGGSSDMRQAAGVVERARIGELAFLNLPVTFAPLGGAGHARVGFDFLSRFAPSVDRGRGRLVLRRTGRLAARPAGTRYPLLIDPAAGARVAREGRLEPVTGALGRSLREGTWTIDARLGEIVVQS